MSAGIVFPRRDLILPSRDIRRARGFKEEDYERYGFKRRPFICPPLFPSIEKRAAITQDQAWQYNLTFSGSTVTVTLTGNPSANSLCVGCVLIEGTTATLSTPTDTFGDSGGGAWQTATGPNRGTFLNQTTYIVWRQIGTGVTGKTVTFATATGSLHVGGYAKTIKGQDTASQPDVVATPLVNQTSANPALASYTAAAGDYIVGYFSTDHAGATAGAGGGGFTLQQSTTDWNDDYVEDQIWAAGGSLVTNLVDASSAHWVGQGVSFKVASSASRPVKMAGEWGGYAGVGGGFAG